MYIKQIGKERTTTLFGYARRHSVTCHSGHVILLWFSRARTPHTYKSKNTTSPLISRYSHKPQVKRETVRHQAALGPDQSRATLARLEVSRSRLSHLTLSALLLLSIILIITNSQSR